jgi:hypothetical protein
MRASNLTRLLKQNCCSLWLRRIVASSFLQRTFSRCFETAIERAVHRGLHTSRLSRGGRGEGWWRANRTKAPDALEASSPSRWPTRCTRTRTERPGVTVLPVYGGAPITVRSSSGSLMWRPFVIAIGHQPLLVSTAMLSSFLMHSRDTSERAAAVQARLQSSLSPEDRFRLALQFSDFAREFAKAALRQRYPTLTEGEINRELTRQLHGRLTAALK